MEKSNKELAVELTKSVLLAMAQTRSEHFAKPTSGVDVKNILNDCYSSIYDLDKGK